MCKKSDKSERVRWGPLVEMTIDPCLGVTAKLRDSEGLTSSGVRMTTPPTTSTLYPLSEFDDSNRLFLRGTSHHTTLQP